MARYEISVRGNQIVDLKELDDEEEEDLGIEWALSEVKDSYRYRKSADGSYSLDGKKEVVEFVNFLKGMLGDDASKPIDDRLARL
jgi:hypothetical protein